MPISAGGNGDTTTASSTPILPVDFSTTKGLSTQQRSQPERVQSGAKGGGAKRWKVKGQRTVAALACVAAEATAAEQQQKQQQQKQQQQKQQQQNSSSRSNSSSSRTAEAEQQKQQNSRSNSSRTAEATAAEGSGTCVVKRVALRLVGVLLREIQHLTLLAEDLTTLGLPLDLFFPHRQLPLPASSLWTRLAINPSASHLVRTHPRAA